VAASVQYRREREMPERERNRRRRLMRETKQRKARRRASSRGCGRWRPTRWIRFGETWSGEMGWTGCHLGLSISLSQPFYLSEPTIQLFIFSFRR
jgi:hypothetical protein